MKIALIFPPYKSKVFSENLATVDEEFCLAPPIILAYVAAILERAGHKVKLLDARALKLTKEEALAEIRDFNPDLLGFRAETYHFNDALDWIKYLKTNLKIKVIAGGVNLTLYPREVLSHKEIDYGIIGEAVESLPKLVSSLENGEDYKRIPGLVYRDEAGRVIINQPSLDIVDFDSYPFPARHLLPNEKYYSFISQRKNFTIMLTSTGCPYNCTFCAIPHFYRTRTPANIIQEIEICYRDFHIREIDFFDAVLLMPKKRMLDFFSLLQEKEFDIEWSCRSRVDVVDDDILREASRAGCKQIYYGIESVNQEVLNNIKKETSPDKIVQAIKLSNKYGIRAMGFFMVGNQGDTPESIRQTINFAKGLDLDFIQVCRTIAKPGTSLDKDLIKETGRDYWKEHILGNKIQIRLPTPWSDLTEVEKEYLTKEFYLKFYLRPQIILRRILQLKSVSELMRYLKVGLRMVNYRFQFSSILTDLSEAEQMLQASKKYLTDARMSKVAVIIPTYNEKDNILNLIRLIKEAVHSVKIVLVDDNSPDGTGDLLEKLANKDANLYLIRRARKLGLGSAYKEGFNFVLNNLDSDFIFQMDADLSHNPMYLPLFIHYARNYSLVTGSRFLGKVSIKNRQLWRNVISKSTKWLVNIATGINLTDVTTGFKCFSRDMLKKIDFSRLKSQGYAFQIETSFNVKRLGGSIREIPIIFVDRSKGKSKMSLVVMYEGALLIFKLISERFFGKKIKK